MDRKLHSIMLVEDNFMTNLYNEKILENLCIADRIVIEDDGSEAIKMLEKNKKNHTPTELIFVDINMPKMSGWEFLKRFRKLEFEKGTKPSVIMLTTSQDPGDEEAARSIPGVIGYLTKPLTEKKILDILNKHFKGLVPND